MAQATLMLACNQYAYGQSVVILTSVLVLLTVLLHKMTLTIEGGYLLEHP